ncbi:adenosylcobalamin-dependent ribonucleoside-diphosphate reductase [Brevibacillus laterosporus]|uniref:adenosylcobalamin-dependent ribonucleoside-diphosphate reductase n=1 Tax=Brevibacillus laterosporus TaxID=1465 RepID=UPI0003740CFC|nr:adenosylcobalamin-dependent ribonucleoside-diphosphate reductase [Brevibacillus laterosporus]ATO50882.1 ribonucleoside-diphosphate reductase, adenosylcobalamin-dependent [Brevibacillus laterosporus DSM 25]MBG9804545.1 ribonucleoside-diphosphate reductase [Brevibacillus laterosporus]MED2002943.1 adenosylcobalamin-dependent ribonucleoside-diphosphate reductase [Brevibacillus laterosporus]MED4763923.1 adenosylcobalamin-dependent ribonucleoside-diphosphate reductase [Brevibacillus laterosporus]
MGLVEHKPLEGLSEKIFLDRYAMKDLNYKNTKVGDTVLLLTKDDPKFPQKEVGEIIALEGNQVSILLRSGNTITTTVEKTTRPIEVQPEAMWDRLATAIASVEKTEEKQAEWTSKFRELLDDWKLVPGGRIAAGAGASEELTLFNCYVIPSPHDSRGGIMDTLTQMTEIMSRGGGVGINLSSLRPRRALVRGVNGSSSGSVSWGGLFSYTTGLIEQGGSRRGALMLMMNDWHPDLMEFITVKQTMGLVTNANLSVCVSNSFMKAVKEDLDWELVFPDVNDPDYDAMWDGNMKKWREELGKPVTVVKTVRAREVWHTIIESAWKSAEPGVVFTEYYNDMSNSWYFNPIICTNPCGEQGLPAWGVCNLSSLNLSKFVRDNEVDWGSLGEAVRYSIRFLDNVIDATPYHFEENRENQQSERRVGLGTMGLAEMMIKLEIRYGSPESLDFLDKLYNFIAREAYLASADIAKEKGSFPKFDAEKYLMSGFMKQFDEEVRGAIREKGIRNVTLLTQAPTGSTGTMVGTSTGIEPYYAFEYFRQSRLGFDKQYVPIAQEWMDTHPGQDLPVHFVCAMDLAAEDHVRVQAAIQKWVDSSISKTANAPHDFTVEDTKNLYELAFDLGCKGVTIYRDGSRDVQVLSTEKKEEKVEAGANQEQAKAVEHLRSNTSEEASSTIQTQGVKSVKGGTADRAYNKRPKRLSGATYKMNTPLGKAYITINDVDHAPFEVIVNVGKAGSDVFAMSEALGRVSTLFLRFGELPDGNKARLLIKHLKGIGGSGAVGFGANRVESIPDAVAKALEMHLDGEDEHQAVAATNSYPITPAPDKEEAHHDVYGDADHKDFCPSCGSATLLHAEGCKTCTTCGFSKCS